MAPGVPGQRGDAVAEFHAVLRKPLRSPQRAFADLTVIGAVDRPSTERVTTHNRSPYCNAA